MNKQDVFAMLSSQAEIGALSGELCKTFRKSEHITAQQLEDLKKINAKARKNLRNGERDAETRDLAGVINRSGLGGILSVSFGETGVTFSHNGQEVTFPKTQAVRLASLGRMVSAAVLGSPEDSEDSAE